MHSRSDHSVLIYDGSRRKIFAIVAFSLLCSWAVIAKVHADPVQNKLSYALATIGVIVALSFLIQAARALPRLRLTCEGFELSIGFTTKRYAWSECSGFSIKTFPFLGPNAIRFFRKGYSADHVIVNLYAASTQEICDSLAERCIQYGGES
jgi:hypothetical protein